MRLKNPSPLRGEGQGWGWETPRSQDFGCAPNPSLQTVVRPTPIPNPSPLEGEGRSRRALLVAAPALVAAPLLAAPAFTRAASGPDFDAIERATGGKLGVVVIDTSTGATTGWRADGRFPFCSAFKAPLAALVLWKVDRGELGLDQPIRFAPSDEIGSYAPITRPHLAEGAMSLSALCAAAVERSDNIAANALLRTIGGPAALTAWMRQIGDRAFQLTHPEPLLNHSHFGDAADTTTPRAMAQSFRRFAFGDVLKPASRAQWTQWLVANTTGDTRLRAGLSKGWRVGDKTGTWNEGWFSTVDIAIACPPGRAPLVIAGFVTDHPSTAAGEAALAEVARQAATWASRHG
jgi:beta-lactamase class A